MEQFALLDSAPDAILVVNERGQIIFANSQVEQLFGYSRHELLGASIEQPIPDSQRAAHVRHRLAYMVAPSCRAMGTGPGLARTPPRRSRVSGRYQHQRHSNRRRDTRERCVCARLVAGPRVSCGGIGYASGYVTPWDPGNRNVAATSGGRRRCQHRPQARQARLGYLHCLQPSP